MKVNKKFGDKVYLEWIDAYSNDGWTTVGKAMEESNNAFCRTNALYILERVKILLWYHTHKVIQKIIV